MKSVWMIAVAAGLGLLLLLFLRGQQSDDALARRDGAGAGLARDDGAGGSGAPLADRRAAAEGAAGGGARSGPGGGAGGFGSGGARDRASLLGGLPASNRGTAAGAAGAAGGDGDSDSGTVAGLRAPGLTQREAPAAGSTGPVIDYDAAGNEVVGEPIPEVAFESAEDRVFLTDSQEEVTDAAPIGGGAGTISFWLKPEWGAGSQEDATLVQLGDSGLEIIKNVNYLRFQFHDSAGGENGLGSNLAGWKENEWRLVTATWAESQLTLYVDGVMVSQERYPTAPEFQPETKLYVGSSFPSGAPAAPAAIASLHVHNRTWTPAEITNQFRGGPPRLP